MLWWVFAWSVMIGSDIFWLPGRYAALAWICRLLCWLATVARRQPKGGLACAKCRLKSAPCAKFRRLTIRKHSGRCSNFGSVSGVYRRAARGCRCRIASLAPRMTEWVGVRLRGFTTIGSVCRTERMIQIQSSLSSRVVRQLARTLVRSGRTLDCTK